MHDLLRRMGAEVARSCPALRRGKVVMRDFLSVLATGDEVLVTGEDVLVSLEGSSCEEEGEENVAAAVALLRMLYCERRALPAVSAPCRGCCRNNSSAMLPCIFDSVWCSAWSLAARLIRALQRFIGALLRMKKDDAAVCIVGEMSGIRRVAHSCCTREVGGCNHNVCWCCCSTNERKSAWLLRLATDAARSNEGTLAVEGKGVVAAAMNAWTSLRPIEVLLGKGAGHAVPGAVIVANTPEPVTTGQKLSDNIPLRSCPPAH